MRYDDIVHLYPAVSRALTVVVLANTEERDLPACLDAIPKGIEVVVIDSGSKDRTVEIAQERGARVVHHAFESFAAQRNFALTQAGVGKPWIAFLDADEIFPAELWAWIEKTIAGDPPVDVYHLPSILYLDGQPLKRAPGYPVLHARLHRSGAANFENGVNGQEAVRAHLRVGVGKIPYLHYFHAGSLKPWMQKHVRIAEEQALASASEGVKTTPRARLAALLPDGPPKALARFCYHYFFRFGFLDGRAGYRYSAMYAWFEMSKWLVRLSGDRSLSLADAQAPAPSRTRVQA